MVRHQSLSELIMMSGEHVGTWGNQWSIILSLFGRYPPVSIKPCLYMFIDLGHCIFRKIKGIEASKETVLIADENGIIDGNFTLQPKDYDNRSRTSEKYSNSSDPHPDILFWHSFWPHYTWHIFSHTTWYSICHSIWHSTWHSTWHMIICSDILSGTFSGILSDMAIWRSGPGALHIRSRHMVKLVHGDSPTEPAEGKRRRTRAEEKTRRRGEKKGGRILTLLPPVICHP